MPLPLAGLRILALTQLGAGPYGMQLLGDLGAEIIKSTRSKSRISPRRLRGAESDELGDQ